MLRTSAALIAIYVAAASGGLVAHPAMQPATSAAALDAFLAAPSRSAAASQIDEVVATGVSFDEAFRRLQKGRTYAAQATGVVRLHNRAEDGIEHHYVLNVPDRYDPARRYQVR